MTARALAALTVAALALTACSGQSSEPLTEPELGREVNRLCATTNRAISRIPAADPLDAAASATVLDRIVRMQRRALLRLRRLEPPDADVRAYRHWLDQVDLVLDQSDVSRRSVRSGDVRAAAAANHRGDELRRGTDRFAAAYGLVACVAG